MADTGAHLVDHVIPRVPVRQWVMSFPRVVRWILAKDGRLLSKVLRIFTNEIFRDQRRRAGIRRAREGRCGAVTGVQRFGGALNLNIHFHTLVLDGVYERDGSTRELRFRKLKPPAREDLLRVLGEVRRKATRLLEKHGHSVGWSEGGVEESPLEEPSVMDAVHAASIREWIALSDEPARMLMGGDEDREPVSRSRKEKPFCANSGDGWNLQAGVRIRKRDREGLERLCRYVLRPPFAMERLALLPDGRVGYTFRRPRPDGKRWVILEPVAFLEKLAALVPPPRFHLVTYHGVLAPNARWRREVVPRAPVVRAVEDRGEGCAEPTHPEEARVRREMEGRRRDEAGRLPRTATDWDGPEGESSEGRPKPSRSGMGEKSDDVGEPEEPVVRSWTPRGRRRRTPWAELLRRTFGVDVLECGKCGGRMSVIAVITEPDVVGKILRAMGLSAVAPEVLPPRAPPQAEFEFVHDSDVGF